MIKLLTPYVLIFMIKVCVGQNLAPNPSFEDTTGCPGDFGQLGKCVGWTACGQSPDYFNSCSSYSGTNVPSNGLGFQIASTGQAYCGIILYTSYDKDIRETMSGKLFQPLEKGKKYFASVNVSLAENALYTSQNIGISFSTISFENSNPGYFVNKYRPFIYTKTVINDYSHWVNIKGSFIADSNYQYILLGNFLTDSLTKREISSSPTAIANAAYYYVDDVCVSADSLTCVSKVGISTVKRSIFKKYNIYPNPFNAIIKIDGADMNTKQITVYDIHSKEIISRIFYDHLNLNLSHLENGIYFYKITEASGLIENGKIIKE